MPGWSDLQNDLNRIEPERRGDHIAEKLLSAIATIGHRYRRNVLFYASSFLQKPQVPGLFTSVNMEDINGFMAGVHGLDFNKGLLLILHTPGGMAEAAQTIIEYLRSKFSAIDVLVPTYAMSAGTMIALGCDRIVMGRQSQLGPTDPQLIVGNRPFSAYSIVEQFEEAKGEISASPILAHAWAPVLRSFGPALLQEARKSISYGQTLVQNWLEQYMFSKRDDRAALASTVASHFGGNLHGSHGRRIDRKEARQRQLEVIDLEDDQILQDEVLTLYHLTMIAFEMGPAAKTVVSSNGRLWIKNMQLDIVMPQAS